MNSSACILIRACAVATFATATFFCASISASAPVVKKPSASTARKVLKPDPNHGGKETKPMNPAAPCDQKLVLNPDGSVETTASDGTKTIRYIGGGFEVREPNGKKHIFLPQNVPSSAPPSAPSDPQLARWLDHVERDLLAEIKAKVGDEASVSRYTEQEAKVTHNVYERIDHRMRLLALMP